MVRELEFFTVAWISVREMGLSSNGVVGGSEKGIQVGFSNTCGWDFREEFYCLVLGKLGLNIGSLVVQ